MATTLLSKLGQSGVSEQTQFAGGESMARTGKLTRLLREERGATAIFFTVFLTFALGLMGAAVDLGALATAKAQLQSAADAAAIAAADTMIGMSNNTPIGQPYTALASAQTYAAANQALGVSLQLKNPPGADFTIGYWNPTTGAFQAGLTGMGITNANDLTGVQVTVRRDTSANTPVSTYFASIFGLNQVSLTATSTAFLGYPSQVPAGAMAMPIAVSQSLASNASGPTCGTVLSIGQNSGSYWTSFFDSPCSNPAVDAYANGSKQAPLVNVGDSINITNGNLSNNTFGDLQAQFNAHAVGGQWTVVMPVIDDGCSHGVRARGGLCHLHHHPGE